MLYIPYIYRLDNFKCDIFSWLYQHCNFKSRRWYVSCF